MTAPLVLDPVVGGRLLADLGFLHVPGRPQSNGSAYLFVGLRRQPTLRHFDPERVELWLSVDGRGTRSVVDQSSALAGAGEYAWGVIRVADRIGAVNDFVSFGGLLSVRRVDEVVVAVLSSVGPIAARGGHSQGFDLGAEEMAAFVGRLRAAAGSSRALERRLAELPPLAIYSAFVADALSRHRDGHGLAVGDERILELLRDERHWLGAEAPADWDAGRRVADRLA